jgi:hypothetical protein
MAVPEYIRRVCETCGREGTYVKLYEDVWHSIPEMLKEIPPYVPVNQLGILEIRYGEEIDETGKRRSYYLVNTGYDQTIGPPTDGSPIQT